MKINKIYTGFSSSIYKTTVLYSCLFSIYDFYKNKTNSIYIASFATSITVSLIIQPFDYYKTIAINKNTEHFLKNVYRGYFLMTCRSIPHFMITMIITEKIKKYIHLMQHSN
jgi:hypothetical protein